jgi:AcrR family transcriptional regulator
MNKEQILEVAAQIICQKGFHATSMQDIAEAVNLQKASLYHHVSSKQEILLSLLDQALELIIERVSPVAKKDSPADVKLCEACQVYLKTLAEHRELVSVLLMEHRSLEPEYHARHVPRRDRFERLWREMIKEGMNSGKFCCTYDPALAARALLGVLNWTITWYRSDGSLSIEQIADYVSAIFLNGLLCR